MHVKLIRLPREHSDAPTQGVLRDGDRSLCNTLEEPWKNNERNVSCIPAGTYKVTGYHGTKFKDCFKLHDVPGRSDILIHSGNTTKDTEGCILVGHGWGSISGLPSVTSSRPSMSFLLEYFPEEFILEVVDYPVMQERKYSFWDQLFGKGR